MGAGLSPIQHRIHGWKVVASLKADTEWWLDKIHCAYPRLEGRGLIEGGTLLPVVIGGIVYPRLEGRGLIEGQGQAATGVDVLEVSTAGRSWPH